jgi:putative effector of murein hydrolase LrgA (UPF0299 family)
VRHILTAQHGRRIAVIVNEFGEELGIERAIVNENDVNQKVYALSRVLSFCFLPAMVYWQRLHRKSHISKAISVSISVYLSIYLSISICLYLYAGQRRDRG